MYILKKQLASIRIDLEVEDDEKEQVRFIRKKHAALRHEGTGTYE